MLTLKEVKEKTFTLIEEASPDSKHKTDDPDLAAKFNSVANQIMFELARLKKIPKYVEINVNQGDTITFEDIEAACGYVVYQLGAVCGAAYMPKANGTVLKILESGTLEVDCYVYPERIDEKTSDSYAFELSDDVLEIMPYGIAADLLKSDVSNEYGNIYAKRYETMLQRLDPRYHMTSLYIEGGAAV